MGWQETNVLNRWLRRNIRWGKWVRTQAGLFYAGQLSGEIFTKIENGKPVRYGIIRNIKTVPMGFTGLPDYVGYHSVIITPNMLGRKVAIAAVMEGKFQDGKTSAQQENVMKTVRDDGGIAFVVRDEKMEPPEW